MKLLGNCKKINHKSNFSFALHIWMWIDFVPLSLCLMVYVLAKISDSSSNIVLLGDFNFKFDDPSCPDVKHITTLLNDHNLTQLIQEPTHVRGHILDWIVVREYGTFVSWTSVNVMDVPFSDHKAIFCSLTAGGRRKQEKRTIMSRNIKKINTSQLCCDFKLGSMLSLTLRTVPTLNSWMDTTPASATCLAAMLPSQP